LGLTHGVPENGPGTYVSYNSDAALAHDKLGMNTFRMSIEWSRIFPKSAASVDISNEGGTVSLADLKALDALANQDEVKHYRDVFAPTTPALERTPKPTQHQGHTSRAPSRATAAVSSPARFHRC
jgi:beta-glucosidase/6-phospho-beta-glucosidase/beta-galactosidase